MKKPVTLVNDYEQANISLLLFEAHTWTQNWVKDLFINHSQMIFLHHYLLFLNTGLFIDRVSCHGVLLTKHDAVWLFLFNPKAVPEFLISERLQAQPKQMCTKTCSVLLCPPLLLWPLSGWTCSSPLAQLSAPWQTAGPQGRNLAFNKAHTLISPDSTPSLTVFTNTRLLENTQPCF